MKLKNKKRPQLLLRVLPETENEIRSRAKKSGKTLTRVVEEAIEKTK